MATEPGLEPTVIRTSNSSNEMLLCAHCGSPSDSLDQQPFPSSRKPDAHWICRCGNPDCGAEIIGRTPEEAIARWNRRVTHETLPPRITVMDDGRAMGGSDVCHTCEAHCTVINDLQTALRGLYWDNVDYLTLDKLGGMQNHWMRAARMALGMDVDDVRHSEKAGEHREG